MLQLLSNVCLQHLKVVVSAMISENLNRVQQYTIICKLMEESEVLKQERSKSP